MKTSEVKSLVTEVLRSLPMPYSQHIIDEVLFSIETTPQWRRAYDGLCSEMGTMVVNCSIGSWVGKAMGLRGREVGSKLNSLSQSYSILDTARPTRPPKEGEALTIMSDYYHKNKDRLNADVRKHRDNIVAMLMEGESVDTAFAIIEENLRRIYY